MVLRTTLAICQCGFLFSLVVGKPGAAAEGPLVLTPENTILVDGSCNSGKYLQWALLKCVAKARDADKFEPGTEQGLDRTASNAFPLYRVRGSEELPAGRNVIAVGATPYLTEAERARLKQHVGSVLLRRTGNVVVVAGDTPHDPWQGEMAAVSFFLNRVCGVRFYAPGPLWWSRPRKPEIVVGDLNVFRKPYFAKTTWSGAWWPNYPHRWERLNKPISEGATLRAGHAIVNYFDPDKYYATHPGIYEQKGDRRPKPTGKFWNPCLSAPELPNIAMEEIRQRMKSNRPPRYLPFGVMDCKLDCHCHACQASVQKHGGSYSNLYYTFLNEVARRCQREFPNLYLTSYIYSNVRRPPEGMTIEPNIVVDYVSKTYQWVNPRLAAAEQREILAWADLGAGWVVHDWSFGGITPRSYTRQFAQFLQWGHQHGMKGLYIEWSHYDNWYLDGARYWIMRRLESDPYQDVDALWRQYCDDMYGAGSEPMYRLFQHFADKYTYADRYCDLRDWPKDEFAMYTHDDLDYQRSLLAAARRLTSADAAVQQRLDQFEPFFRQHELWVQAVGEPSRLAHRHEGEPGVNDAALAFYANDDGSKLREAIAFYRHMHQTDDPGLQRVYQQFNFLPAYAYNYSRGLGQVLLPIRRRVLAGIDLDRAAAQTAAHIISYSRQILRQHLPAKHRPELVRRIEGLLDKVIWVPRVPTMPKFDGKLADGAWSDAVELKGFSVRALLLPSEHKTSGKIMRVGNRLVLALRCEQVGPIWASTPPEIETGTNIWRESGVEVFFGPFEAETRGSKPAFAQYIVNALGAWRGFARAEGNRAGVEVAVRRDEKAGFFAIEAAFPLKAPGYDFTKARALSFNIMRNVFHADTYREDEIIGWAPIFYTARDADSRGLIFVQPAEE